MADNKNQAEEKALLGFIKKLDPKLLGVESVKEALELFKTKNKSTLEFQKKS